MPAKRKKSGSTTVYLEPELYDRWNLAAKSGRILETEGEILLHGRTMYIMHYGLMEINLSSFVLVSVQIVNKSSIWTMIERLGLHQIPVYLVLYPNGEMEILLNINRLQLPIDRGGEKKDGAK